MKKLTLSLLFLIGFYNVWGQDYNLQYPTNALRYYGQDIDAGSSKYTAMAGASGALGGDISSTEQNPAGLGVAISSEVSITAGVDAYKNKSTFGSVATTKDNLFDIRQASGAFVINNPGSNWNRFVIGVNFLNEQLDNEVILGENTNVSYSFDNNQNYVMNAYYDGVSGYKTKFSVNFGTSYNDKLYLGANINFHETNYTNSLLYRDRNVANNALEYFDVNGSPYAEVGRGFSFGLGVLGKVNQNIRLGAAFHSPVWYTVDEEYHALTNSGSYEFFVSDYKLQTGARAVGSIGFVLGKSFALDVDYTHHFNKMLDFSNGSFSGEKQFVDDQVNNTSEVRVGGEYRYNNFRARAGYAFVQSPMKDVTLITNHTDADGDYTVTTDFDQMYIGDANKLSFGLGYDFGGFYIDATYRHVNQKYTMPLTGYLVGQTSDFGLPSTYSADVKNNRNLYMLTLGWQF